MVLSNRLLTYVIKTTWNKTRRNHVMEYAWSRLLTTQPMATYSSEGWDALSIVRIIVPRLLQAFVVASAVAIPTGVTKPTFERAWIFNTIRLYTSVT